MFNFKNNLHYHIFQNNIYDSIVFLSEEDAWRFDSDEPFEVRYCNGECFHVVQIVPALSIK